MKLIQNITIANNTTSVTFSNIPTEYIHLKLLWFTATSNGASEMNINVKNSDLNSSNTHESRYQDGFPTFLVLNEDYIWNTQAPQSSGFDPMDNRMVALINIINFKHPNRVFAEQYFAGADNLGRFSYIAQSNSTGDVSFINATGSGILAGTKIWLYGQE